MYPRSIPNSPKTNIILFKKTKQVHKNGDPKKLIFEIFQVLNFQGTT